MVSTGAGPHRSEWISSPTAIALSSSLTLCTAFRCPFPHSHEAHGMVCFPCPTQLLLLTPFPPGFAPCRALHVPAFCAARPSSRGPSLLLHSPWIRREG